MFDSNAWLQPFNFSLQQSAVSFQPLPCSLLIAEGRLPGENPPLLRICAQDVKESSPPVLFSNLKAGGVNIVLSARDLLFA
jgi:hypothetical protein